MDRVERYRQAVQSLLEKHQHFGTREEDVENQLFFDTARDHYQIMSVGWNQLDRIYHTVLYFDIKDGKIWLQQNTTDVDVGEELIEMGIKCQGWLPCRDSRVGELADT